MQQPNPQAPAIPLNDLFAVNAPPAPLTERMLRWQLRHRKENGLAACCVKLGKKIMISRSRYEQWLAQQAEAAA